MNRFLAPLASLLHWLATPFRAADSRVLAIARGMRDADGRRAAALALMAGAGMAWTLIAIWVIWILRDDSRAVLWMGIGAWLIVFTVVTGYGAMLYKRSLSIPLPWGGTIEVKDQEHAAAIVAAVASASPTAPPPPPSGDDA